MTCSATDSITGYRAAIAVLAQQTGMSPDVDYFINFSHGQKRSVLGLAQGDIQVAAFSDDKLQSMLAKGDIKPTDFRLIYESQADSPADDRAYSQSAARTGRESDRGHSGFYERRGRDVGRRGQADALLCDRLQARLSVRPQY